MEAVEAHVVEMKNECDKLLLRADRLEHINSQYVKDKAEMKNMVTEC